jgi:hypothetical protein
MEAPGTLVDDVKAEAGVPAPEIRFVSDLCVLP